MGSDGVLRRWRGFIEGGRWVDGGVGGGGPGSKIANERKLF